jgi:hypothetical protein
MIAVYHWKGGPHELYVIDVSDTYTETFLTACKDQEYPIPDSGTEVLFLENNKIVEQRFIFYYA